MPQDPFKIDQLQIEPGSGETLLISRDSADGSLRFADNVVTAGLKLSSMCGLRTVDQVRVVGKAGSGAQYTTVQAAIDSISIVDSGVRTPNVVLITPGVYTEDITLDQDGVVLLGLGPVVLESAAEATPDDVDGSNHTVSIVTTNAAHPPTSVTLRNLTITNSHQNKACVHIEGAVDGEIGLVDSTLDGNGKPEVSFGHGGVWINDCRLLARQETTYQVYSSFVNNLYISGGSFEGSHAASLSYVEETAKVVIRGVSAVKGLQLDYDGSGGTPATLGSEYVVQGCSEVGAVASTLTDEGSLTISGCPSVGNVTFNGNRTLTVNSSNIGDLATASGAVLVNSTKGVASGAGTLDEASQMGTEVFDNDAVVSVVFDVAHSDDQYMIQLDGAANILNKAATGFDINYGAPVSTTVRWIVHRET
jgi:hypothetical protein